MPLITRGSNLTDEAPYLRKRDKMTGNKPLHSMFTQVPPHYDLINHIITIGLDSRWRLKAAKECLASKPRKALDLCCGTGDLAINLAQGAEGAELVAIDFSQPMLERALKKAESKTGGRKISFIYGSASNLPFPDGYFDSVGVSFAFRNLTYKNPLARRYLTEILRVLKSGGRLVFVETSQPRSNLVRKLYHFYLRWVVSRLGQLLSASRGAYHYLAESAARFYTPEELKGILLASGFRKVDYQPLLLGVVGIHIAIK